MLKLDERMIRAAAQDAGDRSMRASRRTKWSVDDWNAAAAEYERLIAIIDEER